MAVKGRPRTVKVDERKLNWGRTLQMMRLARGYETQRQFGDALGVTEQAVSAWERGVAAPRDEMRAKIAGLFKVNAADLFPIVRENPERVA